MTSQKFEKNGTKNGITPKRDFFNSLNHFKFNTMKYIHMSKFYLKKNTNSGLY